MALPGSGLYNRRLVTDRKRLPLVGPADTKLGRATIMDRALAQRYGAPYVHLAAFAIDVDRIRAAHENDPALPFAWEVALTEARIVRMLDEATSDPSVLLEDMCLSVMDQPRTADGEDPYGGQLPFALYTGWARGLLPERLESCFYSWRKPPTDLVKDVTRFSDTPGLLARVAAHCLTRPLNPPLVPPAREALEAFAAQV